MTPTVTDRSERAPARRPRSRRWPQYALPVAATWSVGYLGLGLAWLAGAGANPADPAVDDARAGQALLPALGPTAGAGLLTGLAGLGVLLAMVMTAQHRVPDRLATSRVRWVLRLPEVAAVSLGLVLAVVLPDYRLIANVAYTPMLPVLRLLGLAPDHVSLWSWPVVNLAVLTLAGLAWLVAAAVHVRSIGQGRRPARWTTPEGAARWGRWATGVAVVVPLGYAVTRFAWALGIPLGVSRRLLDELGDGVYAGAGLATLACCGAILTLGLVQGWGEVFPRWLPVVRGRRVPVGLAVVPAGVVSVLLTSAGLMLLRLVVSGEFGRQMPGVDSDVAAWLPEMFWPLWGASLAAAAWAYWLRRSVRLP